MLSGRAHELGEFLRTFVDAALDAVLGVGAQLAVLQRRQHAEQQQHRHDQQPHQAPRGAERGAGRIARVQVVGAIVGSHVGTNT